MTRRILNDDPVSDPCLTVFTVSYGRGYARQVSEQKGEERIKVEAEHDQTRV